MRVKNSIINIMAGIGNQLVITLLSFVSRTVFINSLGIEYLGVNGLFTNILSMLTLAEAGIGTSIMYSLYKPVAENDYEKIGRLMRLYRRAYLVIALVVTLLGLSVMPFLNVIVKDHSVEHLHWIYLIFLLNTVTPYFFSYKNAFLSVNQKNYIVTAAFSVTSIISACLKIGILYYTSNYILFLIVDSVLTVITSILLTVIANRKYPYLRQKAAGKLDTGTRNGIVRNVKAIVVQNIGSYLVLETESILISTFVSLKAVGLYSNYKMLIDIARTFINQVFINLYHSVGNLVSSESTEKIYSVYKVMRLLSFWLYSLLSILLYIVLAPFITLWIGEKFLMSSGVLAVLVLLFFERGMRNPITTVKTTAGIFQEDRYVPLAQAAVGLGISIILVRQIGIAGVFIGSLAGALAMPFWTTPYLVYKKVFHRSVSEHYRSYAYFTIIGVGAFFAAYSASGLIHAGSFPLLLLKAAVAFVIVNLIYVLFFHRRDEFAYLQGIARTLLGKITVRFGPLNKTEVD
ncbi:O-antigen/teichoic acid export membrane protein [Paenibacillus forsythiae]|uniref:O-antigen/teichoic acid export membrane protein n=1 Tax=Paenibacillus forsythiae TaxID=365616 RepID=A0ABU3HDB5_9BACL|nr:oligosaccharide flippase family protein [Paenibacillus forsythiae]MDT3428796.1 O-antigen/teichoic acid export membrane protein [Paenibacillus forsythiae]